MSNIASILRPSSLDDFIGQTHLVSNDKPIKLALNNNHIFSMIFWGPPGVGKTTLAKIIANHFDRDFYNLSAVSAKKNDIKDIIEKNIHQKTLLENYEAPILFLDEIHRFNKAQQDFLLPYVENNDLILIGATTNNPSFEVIEALLSRTKIFILEPLKDNEMLEIISRVTKYLNLNKKSISKVVKEWLIAYSNGDARKLINTIETTYNLYKKINIKTLKDTLQTNQLNYDKKGEEHHNTISAFIKSMRASNTDAALYYLARMVSAGEDPKFIARRMIIFASEDIGLAVPTALVVANAVFQAVQNIGYPEAQINLAHGTSYLCKCKKSRASYDGYFKALKDVEKFGSLSIPLFLRNAQTKLMKNIGYGKNYQMYPNNKQSFLPKKLKNKKYI